MTGQDSLGTVATTELVAVEVVRALCGADAAAIQERSGWGLARGLSREDAGLMWDRVLAVHGPHLSHAVVEVDSGGWLAAEELPADARLRQLAAHAQREASWYQRARTRGLVRLDLGQPDQLDLLRRYGPFIPHLQVEDVRATLAEASLAGSVFVPRRLRTTRI